MVELGNLNKTQKLSTQFNHILNQLSNGKCELQLCEFPSEMNCLPAITGKSDNPYYDVYGGMAEITATQSYRDQGRIEFYKNKIVDNLRPIIILIKLKESWSIFILDGHHKYEAYKELNINPRALLISRIETTNLDQKYVISSMKNLGLDRDDWVEVYKDEKAMKYHESNYLESYHKGIDAYFAPVITKP